MKGKIASTKLAQVNGNENLVVGLKQDDQTVAIDLGPAAALQGKNVEVGATIVAIGAMETIGDKDVLIADRVGIDNRDAIEIERNPSQRFAAEIIDVKRTAVGSEDHYMAIVEIDGERQLADLGPVATYKVALQPSTKITIQGVPVQTQHHRVFMAEQVRLGDEVIRIHRSHSL